jgi:SET domain-containing protein
MPTRRPWFELRRSAIQGTGAFALRPIPEGKRLIEYTGERITADEASLRYDDERVKRHHTFLFELDDARCIDARDGGSDARFINHSCAPNCEALIDGDRIFIHSLNAATRKLYACKCGAKKCRGTIAVSRPKKKAKKRAAKKSR